MLYFKERFYLLYIFSILLMLLLAGRYSGFFTQFNNYVYDRILPYTLHSSDFRNDLYIVDTGVLEGSKTDLLAALKAYDMKMVITVPNGKLPAVSQENGSATGINVLSYDVVFEDTTDTERDHTLQNSGMVVVHSGDDGFLRRVTVQNPHLLNTLVQSYGSAKPLNHNGFMRINFNGNYFFKELDAKSLVERSLPLEELRGKMIILSEGVSSQRFSVPLQHQFYGNLLPKAHFLAYAFDSYVSQSAIETYQPALFYIIVLILSVFLLYLFYIVPTRYTVVLGIGLFFAEIGLFWLALDGYNYFLPLFEILSITLVIAVVTLSRERELQKERNSKLLFDISSQLHDKVVHKTFYNSNEYWDQIASMIKQVMDLRASIFFEKLDDDYRIKEVISIDCDFEDIEEMRRDLSREPLAGAIAERRAIRPQRRFFKSLAENEAEYLVPLIVGNHVLGIWAFIIDTEHAENDHYFEELTASFAAEIAELLYKRKLFNTQRSRKGRNWMELVQYQHSDRMQEELKESFAIIKKRMNLSEIIMDNLLSGIMLYDLFGRVMHVNARMKDIIKEESLQPYSHTLDEILGGLMEIEAAKIKHILNDTVTKQTPYSQTITLKHMPQKLYLLSLTPITEQNVKQKFVDSFVFQTYGIMLELVDVTDFYAMYAAKEQLLKHTLSHSKTELQTVHAALQKSSGSLSSEALEKINDHIASLDVALENTLKNSVLESVDSLFAMDMGYYLERSLNDFKEAARRRNVTIVVEGNAEVMVLSTIAIMQRLFSLFFSFLLEDALKESRIVVAVKTADGQVELSVSNDGFGMPNEQLAKLIEKRQVNTVYEELGNLIARLEESGAQCRLESDLGEGLSINVTFDRWSGGGSLA